MISQKRAIISSLSFLCIDVIISYILSFIFTVLLQIVVFYVEGEFGDPYSSLKIIFETTYDAFVSLEIVFDYFSTPRLELDDVVIPSTLLTSVWTFLIFVSSLIAQLLVPIDYLRRFTTWWFKDVERNPLTAIAKVAATLIIVGAMAIKVVRWVY